jgi:two-component system, chemotaxis family, sensor kinase Cph1
LLTYAQVHTKAAELVETDMSALFSEVTDNLQAVIRNAGAEISCERLPAIEVDRSQMRQVFQNLLENAIKYRSAATPEIHVSATQKLNEWIFCVTDNGIGLDMQFADRIFDIFQRLHSRSKYEGTGIGLSICKRIIERHGGRVWIDSEPGKGSSFYFSLPANLKRGPQ